MLLVEILYSLHNDLAPKMKPTPSSLGSGLLNREDLCVGSISGDLVGKVGASAASSASGGSISSAKKSSYIGGGVNPIRRPSATPVAGPAPKKQKQSCIKDIPLTEASKYGSLNEFAFFDKVSFCRLVIDDEKVDR